MRHCLLLIFFFPYALSRLQQSIQSSEEDKEIEEQLIGDEDDDDVGDVDSDRNANVQSFQESRITSVFTNQKSFLCPLVKSSLHTGTSLADLSPEDIDIVAAMGDSIASGRGLWYPSEVDFRGAAFPTGGDANFDGLVTIPNILLEFNQTIEGVSHGMGTVASLPRQQYNTAVSGSHTKDLPSQADELVDRMKENVEELASKWALVTIAVGTEELCTTCTEPDKLEIRKALAKLRDGIPNAFVILLGPVYVASSYSLNVNLMRSRCSCLASLSKNEYTSLMRSWADVYYDVQSEFNSKNSTTFGVLSIPQLTIHSRSPDTLFIQGQPLLNRKGHTFAAKWLWNRLLMGPSYNVSEAVFSEDAYYCPSIGCPYFRTPQNFEHCSIMTQDDYRLRMKMTTTTREPMFISARRETIRQNLGWVIFGVVFFSFLVVFSLGTAFYCHGLKATKGRFEELAGV